LKKEKRKREKNALKKCKKTYFSTKCNVGLSKMARFKKTFRPLSGKADFIEKCPRRNLKFRELPKMPPEWTSLGKVPRPVSFKKPRTLSYGCKKRVLQTNFQKCHFSIPTEDHSKRTSIILCEN